jgi:hypothetical protein
MALALVACANSQWRRECRFRVYFDGVLDDGIAGYGTKTMHPTPAYRAPS